VASPEAAVDPSIRNPFLHGLFPKLSRTRKAYGLRAMRLRAKLGILFSYLIHSTILSKI
jgi:hypothetical protein